MNVSVNEEDIFFACALALNIPLEQIVGIDLEYGFIGEHAFNIIYVEMKSSEKLSWTAICIPESIEPIQWTYDFLTHHGLWRKNEHTHH